MEHMGFRKFCIWRYELKIFSYGIDYLTLTYPLSKRDEVLHHFRHFSFREIEHRFDPKRGVICFSGDIVYPTIIWIRDLDYLSVSRVDVRMDYRFNKRELSRYNSTCRNLVLERFSLSKQVTSLNGRTNYYGTRGKTYFRVYEKGLQTRTSYDWVRWEVELSSSASSFVPIDYFKDWNAYCLFIMDKYNPYFDYDSHIVRSKGSSLLQPYDHTKRFNIIYSELANRDNIQNFLDFLEKKG